MKSGLVLLTLMLALLGASQILATEEESVPTCTVGGTCESQAWGVDAATIANYPAPNVRPLPVNEQRLYDRRYRRVTTGVDIFDTPNGNIVGGLPAGFNFVTVLSEQDGWAQIDTHKWVRAEALNTDVALSRFTGILLPEEPLPYTVAWVLTHLRAAKTPGGAASDANPFLWRYTLVSIYSSIEVDGWRWYQIGEDQWVKQTQVAKMLPVERFDEIDTERWISIDLYEQVMIAYEGSRPVFATLISSGLEKWSTNEGLFHVYIRYPRTIMSGADGLPEFYYLEEVPWTMYYDNDIAVHGAYWHDGFGYRRSRGCVNASLTDAAWLYEWSAPEFDFSVPNDTGPAIYVYSSGDYR